MHTYLFAEREGLGVREAFSAAALIEMYPMKTFRRAQYLEAGLVELVQPRKVNFAAYLLLLLLCLLWSLLALLAAVQDYFVSQQKCKKKHNFCSASSISVIWILDIYRYIYIYLAFYISTFFV